MSWARLILIFLFVGMLVLGLVTWRSMPSQGTVEKTAAPIVVKMPVNVARRTFDPTALPGDMPPMQPGESAMCDTNFMSNAVVGGQTQRTGWTHATLTVTQIAVTLNLNITIWVPNDASQHVIEHEDGHRQISEYYYQSADKLAARIAASYMGKKVEIDGADIKMESTRALQQLSAEITDEFDKELNPNPTQLNYDAITDHARNEVSAADGVAAALKDVVVEGAPAAVPAVGAGD